MTEASDIHVSVKGLDKTYQLPKGDTVSAIRHIDLQLRRGEFVSVVGPSGCGKSTLLKCIAGITEISGGTIHVDGERVTKPPDNMAIVFQRDILLDWRTAIENELFALIGLSGYENRQPWELSGGQRQRVAICRALIQEPKLLLMDEPFGALDALTRDELNLELQRLWMNTHKTVLFITHSISEAVLLSNQVVVMASDPGRILETISIDLPRPRSFDTRETPEFGHYAKHIRRLFEKLGLLKVRP